MDKLWEFLSERGFEIVQGTVTVALVGTMCYQAVVGHPVPDYLIAAASVAMGYFFGSKIEQRIHMRWVNAWAAEVDRLLAAQDDQAYVNGQGV